MIVIFMTIAAVVALLSCGAYALHLDRSRGGVLLFAALLVTAALEILDLLSLNSVENALFWKECALSVESFVPLFWVLCSLTFARQPGSSRNNLILWLIAAVAFVFSQIPRVLPLASFFYSPDYPAERLLFLGDAGLAFYVVVMISLVVSLVNFEITMKNTPDELFDSIKLELVGIIAILAVQLFYFSQGLLYRSLNMNYMPLRSLVYLIASALIIYSLTFGRRKVHIQLSRQFAFKSVALVAVGLYMVLLALLGEGMQYFGTFLPRTIMISVAFSIGIALLVLMLSEKVRREVKLFLNKNFYPNKHDYRTQWLRFTAQLSTSRSGDELLQHIQKAYCEIFGFSGSTLFLYEKSRGGYSMQAAYMMTLTDDLVSPESSIVSFLSAGDRIMRVSESASDLSEEDRKFLNNNSISFAVQLPGRDKLEGFILLGLPLSQKEVYNYEDFDLMKTISMQASMAILHQRLSEEVTHAREIEAIGNVATFVAHDLKNLVSNLSLIVENAPRYIHNPDFQEDMLMSIGNTVVKMQKLISRLKNLGEHDHIKRAEVNLLELVEKTVQLVSGATFSVSGERVYADIDENEIQKVILNLIMNAIEASASPDDQVDIEVGSGLAPFIKVTDRGCGMSAKYMRTELFKPFKTTKKQGLGIGLYQCRKIVEAHGGRIEVSSQEGAGTTFTILLTGINT